jgi:hypothetical protein
MKLKKLFTKLLEIKEKHGDDIEVKVADWNGFSGDARFSDPDIRYVPKNDTGYSAGYDKAHVQIAIGD